MNIYLETFSKANRFVVSHGSCGPLLEKVDMNGLDLTRAISGLHLFTIVAGYLQVDKTWGFGFVSFSCIEFSEKKNTTSCRVTVTEVIIIKIKIQSMRYIILSIVILNNNIYFFLIDNCSFLPMLKSVIKAIRTPKLSSSYFRV